MSKDLNIIVPVYNEEKNIEETIKSIVKYSADSDIWVINDASTDKTPDILQRIKRDYPNLKVISHKKNRGYGGALKTGFLNVKTKYVAFLDADLTYHPKYINSLLDALKRYDLDFAWGNRFGGKNSMPLVRKIGNKILVFFFMLITGKYVPDITSGERVCKVDSLMKINFKTLPNGLNLTPAMTKRIVHRKLKFKTLPIDYYMREGNSKLNIFNDFLRMAKGIIFEK